MTSTALTLFGTAEDDIELRFHRFDEDHPEVFQAIARIALRRLDAGCNYLSMKWIYECLRTDSSILRDKGEVVKVNNNHTALYARKLVAQYPELAPLFRTRKRTAASALSATSGTGSFSG